MMDFDKEFIKEETRCDFFVSEKRKKVWYVELELLKKFDEVCKAYGLTYFADYGTLLGAVRHQGFIPWDDDMDIVMFRDDYAKFQKIAPTVFCEPYFYQNSYTDQQIWAFSKLRDSRTTAIEFPDFPPSFHQGIFIDIYPIDDAPDDTVASHKLVEMKREIWLTIVEPESMLNRLNQGTKFMLSADILFDLLKLPITERFRQFEDFNLANFGQSKMVDFITRPICAPKKSNRKREWFSDVVYLPFESLMIPAPVGYDELLKSHYGDYHVMRKFCSVHNGIFIDPDTPYLTYMEHPDHMDLPRTEEL